MNKFELGAQDTALVMQKREDEESERGEARG